MSRMKPEVRRSLRGVIEDQRRRIGLLMKDNEAMANRIYELSKQVEKQQNKLAEAYPKETE